MISIKEIARLSNVSMTTVSKIVNNKADDISQETIDKVLKVVKQYNYTPYGNSRSSITKKTFTIALLLKKMSHTNLIMNGMIQVLNQNGYTLMLLDSDGSLEEETKNLSKISRHNPDGLVWEPVCGESLQSVDILKKCNTKILYIEFPPKQDHSYFIDYKTIGYFAADSLIRKGHTKIACVTRSESRRSLSVASGFKQCLFDHNIAFHPDMVIPFEDFRAERILAEGFSALLSSHFAVAQKLIVLLKQLNISIPYDLSLLSLRNDMREETGATDISTIKIPYYEFGVFAGEKIISCCEAKETDIEMDTPFTFTPAIESYKSINIPHEMRLPKITVVGSINIDNTIYLDDFPTSGITSYARECISLPGGKGLNQAIGAAMQKKEVTLIGKIGKDTEGGMVCKTLSDNGIETASLITNFHVKTGKAFIIVDKDGDSIVTVMEGANSSLKPEDITNCAKYFENTGICLLQTEIPLDVVREAARIAKVCHATTILKPASISRMEDADYQNIDIFVPNRKEAIRLSGRQNVEEAADYFLTKGLKTIIITLDHSGVLLRTKDVLKYYDAPKVDVIDATGGSDAFISTLAAKLLDHYGLDKAIRAASIAAGFCISKFGVSNSMIDYSTLESYMIQKNIE